jgi:3-hydroxyisobutyrate dehydrogenase-like beta-hydroxyacid dehydrogenase
VASRSPSEPIATVGFIGVGDMGGAMVRRIVDTGWSTVLWARRPDALTAYAAPGVDVAETPAALAAAADLVGICVWADDDVRDVLTGDQGVLAGARPGTVVAIHSTILPSTCRELAAAVAPREVTILDAPVSGGGDVALSGGLTVAVGGDAAAVARCRPVFDAFASTVVHLGPVGAGQVAKLLNNALFAANVALADDALTLGESLGIDACELERFLETGSSRSYALGIAARFRTSDETRRAATPALAKDVRNLAAETDDAKGAHLLHAAAAGTINRLQNPPPGWSS